MKPLYLLAWILGNGIARTIFRMKMMQKNNIPRHGAFILASNHISLADPPLVGISVDRPVHFMAKKELFRNRLFGGILRRINAHPLKRTGIDRKAFETASDILNSGEPLVIFPEGTRARNNDFLPPRPGVGMIARNCLVPVIPVYIGGSDRFSSCFLGKSRLGIIFGSPFGREDILKFSNTKEGYRDLANEIMIRIKDLKVEFKNRVN